MATDLTQISKVLEGSGVHFHREPDFIVMGWQMAVYANKKGENHIVLVIDLPEDGEYFRLFAPEAFRVDDAHAEKFLVACAMIQWRTKLIQFEYDPEDGEVRPIVEFPLEDAPLTERQLMRCIRGMLELMDQYFPTLQRAQIDGEIVFEEIEKSQVDMLGRILSDIPPDVLADALRLADAYRRRN